MTIITCLSVTSSYFDVQSCADEWHQGGGEVDRHVLIHRHVHQHQPLRDNKERFIHSFSYQSESPNGLLILWTAFKQIKHKLHSLSSHRPVIWCLCIFLNWITDEQPLKWFPRDLHSLIRRTQTHVCFNAVHAKWALKWNSLLWSSSADLHWNSFCTFSTNNAACFWL